MLTATTVLVLFCTSCALFFVAAQDDNTPPFIDKILDNIDDWTMDEPEEIELSKCCFHVSATSKKQYEPYFSSSPF